MDKKNTKTVEETLEATVRPPDESDSDPEKTTDESSESVLQEFKDFWSPEGSITRESFWGVPPVAGIKPELSESKRFNLLEAVGEGAFGQVMLAEDTHLNRTDAIKILKTGEHPDQRRIKRFIEEAATVASLDHPNIAPIYDLDVGGGGSIYLVMKRVEGDSLMDLVKKAEGSDLDNPHQVAAIFESLCNAAAFAHSKGVIHQDIKPANVMIGEYGEIYLLDWGSASGPGPCKMRGTPIYMAPEQVHGEGVDEKTDVYCIGGTLLYTLLRRHPVSAKTEEEFWKKKKRLLDRCPDSD